MFPPHTNKHVVCSDFTQQLMGVIQTPPVLHVMNQMVVMAEQVCCYIALFPDHIDSQDSIVLVILLFFSEMKVGAIAGMILYSCGICGDNVSFIHSVLYRCCSLCGTCSYLVSRLAGS